jgi:hypothetical protein
MSRRLIFRYFLIFPFFFTVISLVLPRLSPLTFNLGKGEYSSVPRLWVISFMAFKGASSSPSLRIAALMARDGYPNTIFRFNRPAKGDSPIYPGYRPQRYVCIIFLSFFFGLIPRSYTFSQPCVRPLQIPVILPSPSCTPVYLIPVLYCPHSPSQCTGGGVLNSTTATGLFFRVTARR